jgi:hypothetical protein
MSSEPFYSPVVDRGEALRDRERLWPDATPEPPGIDMRAEGQIALLEAIRPIAGDFSYPHKVEERRHPYEFHEDNGLFEGLDARMWFCLARHLRPQRIVEVGGGFSTLLAADVNRRYFDGRIVFLCIEPSPANVLLTGVPGLSKLLPFRVQEVPLRLFESLRKDDVLFIDSSHVSKTGSDVNFLCLEVLPRLAPGVLVHFHDVFLPGEYPVDWVLQRGYSWNEQYLVQALLIDSVGFEVVFGSWFASQCLAEHAQRVFGHRHTGASLWLRRTGRRALTPSAAA